MNDFWTSAGMWMLQTAMGGGLVLLLTCVAMRCTAQPARRQRLGECGLIAGLLVALGSAVGPAWLVIAWSDSSRNSPLVPPMLADSVLVPLIDKHEDATLLANASVGLWESETSELMAGRHEVTAFEQEKPAQPLSASWKSLAGRSLVFALTVAAGFFALRLLVGYVGLFRLMLRCETASDEIRGLFETMAAGTRWLRLLVSRRLLMPLSCGLWRPTVVLPSAMCERTATRQLRWIFTHELTHLRRRDAWSTLLLNLGQILFFALPWYWWLRRQVRLCQEFIADAAAAGQSEESVEYAEFLLSLASAPAVPVGACAVFGRGSDLSRRVTMLLNDSVCVENRCPRRWTALAAVGLSALAVFMSGVAFRAEASPDEQVVIVVRPQDGQGQTDKLPEVRIKVTTGDGKKVEKAEDAIIWQRVPHEYHLPSIQWIADADVRLPLLEEKQKLSIKEGHLLFVPDVIVLERFGATKGKLKWVFQFSDNLTPLRDALRRLEALQKEGKLTKDAIQTEVTKALKEIKAPIVNPTFQKRLDVEVILPGQGDAKDQQGPQIVLSVADLQKLLTELERIQSTAAAYIAAQEAYKKEVEKDLAKALWEKGIKDRGLEKAFTENRSKAITLLNEARLLGLHRNLDSLGVKAEGLGQAMAEQLQLPKNVGLWVQGVTAKSPFGNAGIKVDDILVKIAGAMVPGSVDEFNKFIDSLKSEVPLDVVVLRKGKMESAGKLTLPVDMTKRIKRLEPVVDVIDMKKIIPEFDFIQVQPDLYFPSKSVIDIEAKPGKSEWSKWGTLRKTNLKRDGQLVYRLEDERGAPLDYVIAAPGLDLESHIGRMVAVYGYHQRWDDIQENVRVVTQTSLTMPSGWRY